MNAQSADSNFPIEWNLTDLKNIPKNGLRVFSTFSCGGGSTMGYKLAGCDVIAGCDIDPRMKNVYCANFAPKYFFLSSIRELVKMKLPTELYGIDILDGSPPCSTFSMAGNRDKDWGKNKKFREGQTEQVLDDLFFDFLNLAEKIKPKIIIAENVKGIIQGKARGYVKMIEKRLADIGYSVQIFLLDASTMGVPQRRERVFFIATQKKREKLNLVYNIPQIPFSAIYEENGYPISKIAPSYLEVWKKRKYGEGGLSDTLMRIGGAYKFWDARYIYMGRTMPTISAQCKNLLFSFPRMLTKKETILASTFPQDYNFLKEKPTYVCGMSVPPVMMARIVSSVLAQWHITV